MDAVLKFIQNVEISDFFDILLVTLCIYSVLLTIQKTRAVQIIQGVGVILLLMLVAQAGRLQTLAYMLNWFLVSLAVIVPIIFQPELRRALMRLGAKGVLSTPSASRMDKQELASLVDGLGHTAVSLATLRHGALIVLERETGLEDVIESGTRVDGLVSDKLLISLFHPKTPLHDGAIIIRGNRMIAAGCYLPLSSQSVDAKFGTRHRAALGVSEQSDCVVLIVSEESGEVRVAQDGSFSRPLQDEGEIMAQLNRHLSTEGKPKSRMRIPLLSGGGS